MKPRMAKRYTQNMNKAYQQGRQDAIDECKNILMSAIAEDGKTKCAIYVKALNEMEQLKDSK